MGLSAGGPPHDCCQQHQTKTGEATKSLSQLLFGEAVGSCSLYRVILLEELHFLMNFAEALVFILIITSSIWTVSWCTAQPCEKGCCIHFLDGNLAFFICAGARNLTDSKDCCGAFWGALVCNLECCLLTPVYIPQLPSTNHSSHWHRHPTFHH